MVDRLSPIVHNLLGGNTMNLISLMYRSVISLFIIASFTFCSDDELSVEDTQFADTTKTIDEINTNIKALQRLVKGITDDELIKQCTPLADSRGYLIQFSSGEKVTILTKISPLKDDAENIGYSPILTVRKHNNNYYWCLDGEWLHQTNNDEKLLVVASTSIPIVDTTSDGYWKIQLGNVELKLTHKVEVAQVKSLFRHVEILEENQVKIYMQGETSPLVIHMEKAEEPEPAPSMGNIRRPISNSQPAWLVHIDTWNTADPQKIIDLIPQDIKPYVIFNISLSVNHNEETGDWKLVEYGYETAKSWLRTCAENQVWAMVQPSSGAFSHFPDLSSYDEIENSLYEEFYRDYPNFVGFNYCEQFWGFNDPFAASFTQRLRHWTHLMKLNQKYGGYLVVSFCGPQWAAANNPIAMMKSDAAFAEVCRNYPENFILCEKYTSKHGFYDVESTCLGTWLSGYSGHYGIRFDECGWNAHNGDDEFPVAAGAIPIIEHVALTGQTIIDGPELIWQQCFKEVSSRTIDNGYITRVWETFPQFQNINIDLFRKIIDGSIRIMSREEVIERSKIVILQDIYSGNSHDMYCSPFTLYEGLYRMDDDGNLGDNHNYFKKTGRYPTIPVAWQLTDEASTQFVQKIGKSTYDAMWPTIDDKVRQFNLWFPQQSTGTLYVGRHLNTLVTYNPSNRPDAVIPFKYNTAQHMELLYSKYTIGLIREYNDKITCYLNNYDPQDNTLREETIKIYGCNDQPSYTYTDRGNHQSSQLYADWTDGVFTLVIKHNGPLDIVIQCHGDAVNRENRYPLPTISQPSLPEFYNTEFQYEAENFDYKECQVVKNGVSSSIRDYTAMGYMKFGNSNKSSIRCRTKNVPAGTYSLQISYLAINGDINDLCVYVNNERVSSINLLESSSHQWENVIIPVTLKAGSNNIELHTDNPISSTLYIDNFILKSS